MDILGIDLAKKTFDVTLLTPAGTQLPSHLSQHADRVRRTLALADGAQGHIAAGLYGGDQSVLGSPRLVSG